MCRDSGGVTARNNGVQAPRPGMQTQQPKPRPGMYIHHTNTSNTLVASGNASTVTLHHQNRKLKSKVSGTELSSGYEGTAGRDEEYADIIHVLNTGAFQRTTPGSFANAGIGRLLIEQKILIVDLKDPKKLRSYRAQDKQYRCFICNDVLPTANPQKMPKVLELDISGKKKGNYWNMFCSPKCWVSAWLPLRQ